MTKTKGQRAEIGIGAAMNFVGGMLMQSKLGIGIGLALEATGDYLTQKGMGVKDVNKKKIAESVGISLAETLVFAGVGKYAGKIAGDWFKSYRTAQEDALNEKLLPRYAMMGEEGMDDRPHFDAQNYATRVQRDKRTMAGLQKMGGKIDPYLRDIEVRPVPKQALDSSLKGMVLGEFISSEEAGPSGRNFIKIATHSQQLSRPEIPIRYEEQEKTYLHEAAHAMQKFHTPAGKCCQYGHGEDFLRLHNIAVIKAYGTGSIEDFRFARDYSFHYTPGGPTDALDIKLYYDSLTRDFEKSIGRPFREYNKTDLVAFKKFLADVPWDYVPKR